MLKDFSVQFAPWNPHRGRAPGAWTCTTIGDTGPDLDLWGPLGRQSCGGPWYHKNIIFYGSDHTASSEASESRGVDPFFGLGGGGGGGGGGGK